jgi:NADPH:quinone reductase-like Zn-dependent oxidoreductase
VREGAAQQMAPLSFPATLGGDVAGIVSELGTGVSELQVGDEVYGLANALSGVGSFAEFTPVAAGSLAAKPKNIDFVAAAAVPLAAGSAYQALVEHIGLKSGQKILIHGGGGGIGMFAVQIAKHLGAYVATTATSADAEFVKSLGADEVIDYKNTDFTTVVKDYDAVFDTVGGDTATKSYAVLRRGGTLVSMTGQPDEAAAKEYGITAISQQSKVTGERLREIAQLIDEGSLKIYVDKVFPLDEAAEALAYLQSDAHHGKVVIEVKKV